jgi:hypothetical protein
MSTGKCTHAGTTGGQSGGELDRESCERSGGTWINTDTPDAGTGGSGGSGRPKGGCLVLVILLPLVSIGMVVTATYLV